MYEDITEIYNDLIRQHGSIDIAEAEFKKMIAEDDDLRQAYRDWCHEVGSSEKNGFMDYCNEYLDSREEIWDSLNTFDE